MRRHLALLLSTSALVLTGCSANFAPSPTTSATPLGTIRGIVHGGQQAVQGAHIYLFAVSTSGYGAASTSLLASGPDTTSDGTNYYVTSGSAAGGGQFSISGDYNCTEGQQVYLYAVGGSSDAGTDTNNGIGMMAGLGACPAGGSLAAQVPYVTINEVSTIVTAYSLAGFATDATHISSSGTTLANTGVTNAMANVANLLNVANGTARTTTNASDANATGNVPVDTINLLANILAACINTPTEASSNCTSLFGAATSDSTLTGTKPTDTATAAINIAHTPGANTATLFGLAPGVGAPFTSAISATPTDFTLGINYTSSSLWGPEGIAIDASGNAWVTNNLNPIVFGFSVTELSSLGAAKSGANGYSVVDPSFNSLLGIAIDRAGSAWIAMSATGVGVLDSSGNVLSTFNGGTQPDTNGGLNPNYGIAIDASGNAWIANYQSVTKLSSSGDASADPSGYTAGGLSSTSTYGIAIDGAGSAWIATQANSVIKLSSTGTAQSGSSGYTNRGGMNTTWAIALDATGNAWIANQGSNTISELSNTGAALSTSSGYTGGGLYFPNTIAIDGVGNAWIGNSTNGSSITSVSEFSGANSTTPGTPLSGSSGFTGGGLSNVQGIAIDGSGNVWTANEGNSSVTEFIGAAAPVITPIAAGLPLTPTSDGTSLLGTRP